MVQFHAFFIPTDGQMHSIHTLSQFALLVLVHMLQACLLVEGVLRPGNS